MRYAVGFMSAKLLAADQAVIRLRSSRACRLTKSGRGQQFFERRQLDAAARRFARIGVRRVGEHVHFKRRDQPHQLAAAVTQPDDAQRAALDFAAQHLGLQVPPARSRDALLFRQPLGQAPA